METAAAAARRKSALRYKIPLRKERHFPQKKAHHFQGNCPLFNGMRAVAARTVLDEQSMSKVATCARARREWATNG
jgi:hypothetical protein